MITSAHNPKIQLVRALLARRQEREQTGAFVVEGVRLCEEAAAAGWAPKLVLHAAGLSARGQALLPAFQAQGAEVEEVPASLLESVAGTQTPQGILAVLPIQPLPIPPEIDFLLVADRISDPGNLGTLLRTAAAAGTGAVALAPGTVDAFAPKVVRAGMGAHFRLPVRILSWEEIAALCQEMKLKVYVAEAEQGIPAWSLDLRQPLALVVGGEAEGAGPEALDLADGLVTIPMPGKSESLNAAVAAGILLFEIVRQRTSRKR